MGYEAENEARKKAFADWCVDAEMMAAAKPDALFMHCLPAHRGEEVEADVIDGPQSVVWDEAENRMHVQKALMEYLLLGRVTMAFEGDANFCPCIAHHPACGTSHRRFTPALRCSPETRLTSSNGQPPSARAAR
jgi:hypothetical protein